MVAETIETAERNREKWKKYDELWEKATPKKTEEMKEKWKESLNTIEKIDIKKYEEKPWYPLIERFKDIPWVELNDKDIISIFKWIWISNDKEDIITQIEASIENVVFSKPETKDYIRNYLKTVRSLNKKEDKKDNKDNSKENEKKRELPKAFKEYSFLNNIEDDNVQLLVSNYLILPDWKNWKADDNKDLETAFKITINKLIEGKQIHRNEAFEIAMNDIQKWSIESKFYALKYINSLVQTTEWSQWNVDIKNFNKMKDWHKLVKKEYLEFKIGKLEKLIKETTDDWEKLRQELELDNLKEELNKDDFEWEGEVFTWNNEFEKGKGGKEGEEVGGKGEKGEEDKK